MANNTPVIIKRSTVTATPISLNNGEPAYSSVSNVLFIGDPLSGNVTAIGGLRTPGVLTANQALVANSTGYINQINAANVNLSYLSIANNFGSPGQILYSNGTGIPYWSLPAINQTVQYTWTNNHTFTANLTVGNSAINTSNLSIYGSETVTKNLNVGANATIGNSLNVVNNINATSIVATSNLNVGVVGVTSGILLNNTSITVGNSTITSILNSLGFITGNSTVNSSTNSTSSGIYSTTGSVVKTPSYIALANTTANVFLANTSGIYSTGGLNAISYISAGPANNFLANSTTLLFTGSNVSATSANVSLLNLAVSGNLSVSGSVISLNTQTLTVNDNIIEVGVNNTSTDLVDTGIFSPAGNTTTTWYSGLARIASLSSNNNAYFQLFSSAVNPNNSMTIDRSAANTSTGTLQALLAPYGSGGAFIANTTAINIIANSTISSTISANTLTLSNALLATSGGTGKNSYAAGDLTYAATANPTALTSLPVAANGYILQIINNMPAYGALDGGTF